MRRLLRYRARAGHDHHVLLLQLALLVDGATNQALGKALAVLDAAAPDATAPMPENMSVAGVDHGQRHLFFAQYTP
jgi:hypothetical protein